MRTALMAAGLVALTSSILSAQQPSQLLPGLELSAGPRSTADSTTFARTGPKFPLCDYVNHSQEKADARREAIKEPNTLWFAMGGVGGLLLPVVSAGFIAIGAFHTNPLPDSIPLGADSTCYLEGFRKQERNERAVAGFVGGLVATGIGLIAVLGFHANDAIVFPFVPGKIGKDN
ncbi:MAG: hypothetical protein EXR93_12155 [Gemmatimonadetes bacterium]|nr:hypothetical protein [Gemmatimonadota bacterium]